jgi:hypothetical protein
MKTLKRLSKITLLVSLISGGLWLGGYVSRLFLFYQLFAETDFELKPYVTVEALPAIFITLNSIITFTLITYIIFLISFILFLLTSKINLKKNGWLFIITLVVFITAPFELYLMTIDYEMATKIFYGSFDSSYILGLVIKRFETFSSFTIIHILSYFAIIYYMVYKPFALKNEQI